MNKSFLPQLIISSFKSLSDYLRGRWVSSIATVLFLAFSSLIGIGIYFIYINLDKGIMILESTYNTPESLQDGLITSVTENIAIDKELTSILLGNKDAVAVIYFKFHNSKTDLQGKHDFYYSAVNEITREPSLTFMPQSQSIPITKLGQFMIPFIENKCQTINVNEITGNSWIKMKLKSENIGMLSTCPVYDRTEKFLIGFIEIIYSEETPKIESIKLLEECLSIVSKRISFITEAR